MPDFDKEEYKFPDEIESKVSMKDDDEEEFTVEIEDDTPEEDRGKEPLPKDIHIYSIKKGAEAPSQLLRLHRVNRTYQADQTNRTNNAHETCNVHYQYRSRRPLS